MMKRILSICLAAALTFALVGCGSEASQPSSGPKDYAAILSAARTEEDNSAIVIFTYKDGEEEQWGAQGAYAADLGKEDVETQAEMGLEFLGLDEDDVTDAAFSVSLMNVQAYGVAIVKPAEGKTDEVKEALSAYIEAQKAAQQNYLADQYEIAKAAKLETLKSGEVVLVMCKGQDSVFSSIKDALK